MFTNMFTDMCTKRGEELWRGAMIPTSPLRHARRIVGIMAPPELLATFRQDVRKHARKHVHKHQKCQNVVTERFISIY